MSRKSLLLSIGIMLGASLLGVAPAGATVYAETGDAGDTLATVQTVSGSSNTTPLTGITGTTTATNGIFDGDMFKIYIASSSSFSASTTAFVIGANNFDSQLFLFTAGGIGVETNDDDPSGASQSTIGGFTGPAGYYDLLITGSGRYPTSSGGLIFPNFTDGSTDPSGTYGPTGPGGGSALSGYTGNTNEGGNYSIALTGAQFGPAAVTAVPEPSTIVVFATGLASLFFVRRRRAGFPYSNASVSPL